MVTGEMVEQLILNGADIIKVGIGPGECNKGIGCSHVQFLFRICLTKFCFFFISNTVNQLEFEANLNSSPIDEHGEGACKVGGATCKTSRVWRVTMTTP